MSDTTTSSKTRTITLTNRPPVKIREAEWPVIASAVERPGSFANGTPVSDDETDEYSIRVRQHVDGRTIIYGRINAATAWTHTEDWRGGELLTAGADVAAAIRRVGESGAIIDSVIRQCIADLPPEEI